MSNQDPSDSEAASGGFEVGKFDDYYTIETEDHVGNVRRIVVGGAAAIALLVGAILVYNASSTDESADPPLESVEPEPESVERTAEPAEPEPEPAQPEPEPIEPEPEPVEPEPTWTEISPSWTAAGLPRVYSVETVGDGRILARAVIGPGNVILISENGTDWTQVAVPDGLSPDLIDISGDRWLIAGPDTTPFTPAHRAYYSDNRGGDWTELALEEVPGNQSSIILALASGRNMVIVFEISDDGQDPPDEALPDKQIMVYRSDGETTARIGESASIYTSGYSNVEGFYIVISASEEESLLASADGLEWSRTPTIDGTLWDTTGFQWSTHKDSWYIETFSDETRVKSLDQIGYPESVIATIRPVSHLISLDVGPAGMVVLAVSDSSPRELLLGVSTDGSNWEWQDPSVAFGVAGGQAGLGFAADEGYLRAPSVDFAVGTDFVLARVTEFDVEVDAEHPQIRSIRWFKETLE